MNVAHKAVLHVRLLLCSLPYPKSILYATVAVQMGRYYARTFISEVITMPPCIIIEGITKTGSVFRPRNWAERLACNLGTFEGGRLIYSPLVSPCNTDKYRELCVQQELEKKDPALYRFYLDFARNNNLVVEYRDNKNE